MSGTMDEILLKEEIKNTAVILIP